MSPSAASRIPEAGSFFFSSVVSVFCGASTACVDSLVPLTLSVKWCAAVVAAAARPAAPAATPAPISPALAVRNSAPVGAGPTSTTLF